jgi:uncharacterized protein (DUF2062 family)
MRKWIEALAGTPGPPHRVAAAFALGVFLSFSPFLGFQIAIGAALAFALRLSRAAVLIGLCTNLPFLMVPWYALTTAAGAAMLEIHVAPDFTTRLSALLALPVYRSEFWQRAVDVLWPLFWAFTIGSIVGALIVGSVTYFVTLHLLRRVKQA